VVSLAQLELGALVRRCIIENDRFRHSLPSDPSYAYELFRRALAERDDGAWSYLYDLYRSLVERWVCKSAAFEASGEPSETLVGEAFARFWQAIPPARFANFPNVAALLHYLQLCAGCVVIDSARAVARLVPTDAVPLGDTHQRGPDDEVMEQMRREELWRYIIQRLNGEAERAVIVDSFVSGLKPSDICARRPDLFASVKEVYMVKRNVIERLGRDQGLRALLA
jgi:DNA-directed RNA polymerase specialized sigma24 family protein